MSYVSHRHSFGRLLVILAFFHFHAVEAASLTTHVRELPPEFEQLLKDLPRSARQAPPSAPVADLYFCDPYCESIGNVSPSGAGRGNGGFSVTFNDEASKSKSLDPSLLSKFRVVSRRVTNAQNGRQEDPSNPSSPSSQQSPTALQNPGNRSGNRATAPRAAAPRAATPRPSNPRATAPGAAPGSWSVSGLLGASFGSRSLQTDANTNLESGAKPHLAYEARIGLLGNGLLPLWAGRVSAGAEIQFQSTLSEAPQTSASPRDSVMIQGGVLIMAEWRKRRSNWGYAFLLEPRYISFSTKPETADGFSSTYILVSPGIGISYRNTSLRILHSVYGLAQDSVAYRGEEVSAGILRVELRSCTSLGKAAGAQLSLCGNARRDALSVQASGEPLRAVFTPNGKHEYSSIRFGIELGLTGFSL